MQQDDGSPLRPAVARPNPDQPGGATTGCPDMVGIRAEVQHAVGQGQYTAERGVIGLGLVLMPNGQPKVSLQMKHPDGTSLGALLIQQDLNELRSIIDDVDKQAQAIADATKTATRQ